MVKIVVLTATLEISTSQLRLQYNKIVNITNEYLLVVLDTTDNTPEYNCQLYGKGARLKLNPNLQYK